ncbi:TIR domain-containing protein [Allopusillimonas ginsengisoli]|uniref:TIR domain-containing protein n=1 Tax=Allopusillimonas ginsengisoli TaxID=453575 RepID=UPI0010C16D2C|nr:cyclic nucleotide-binding domain-containing protein [Allopusillimonas ginsengisoli]
MATEKMIQRFEGSVGRSSLEEVLLEQKLIVGNEELAKRLADEGSLIELSRGQMLIEQDAEDTDVYFILTGQFQIRVHGREVATRGRGEHVGEMAALVTTAKRSATVIATEPSIVLKVSANAFKAAADTHPRIWQHVTRQLVERLTQRNTLVRPASQSARVFIISSVEGLPIAREVERQLEHDKCFVKVWTEGTFRASKYTLESLESVVEDSDFAIAIAQPDDQVERRGESHQTPRDNVIFELGMFVGKLGRHRSLLLEPRGDEVDLPSDLSGLTTISYRPASGKDPARLGPACTELREIFNELGPR